MGWEIFVFLEDFVYALNNDTLQNIRELCFFPRLFLVFQIFLKALSQMAFTYSNSVMETSELWEICSKLTVKTPDRRH